MDDIWLRVTVIAGVLAIAGLVVIVQRQRAQAPVRAIGSTGLEAGVYFFSSATCSSCEAAREKLDAAMGEDGYTEFVWENEPDPFTDLKVNAVPAVLIVRDGRGRLYPGQPDRALLHL